MCDEGSITFGANGDGAHAKYMKVPADSLVALPDDLSFRAGAAVSCGTGTAWGGLDRLGLRGSETIAIFGQGPVGLSGTQLAAAMGARVIALDIDPGRLNRAKEFGAPRDHRRAIGRRRRSHPGPYGRARSRLHDGLHWRAQGQVGGHQVGPQMGPRRVPR
jgi:D-arabinose 1-dehydrogenase-like Zn-dependent alcohol dehydrogenase